MNELKHYSLYINGKWVTVSFTDEELYEAFTKKNKKAIKGEKRGHKK